MKKLSLLAAAAVIASLLAVQAGPQLYTPVNTAPYQWKPDGYSQFSITGTGLANLVGAAGGTLTAGTLAAIPTISACATIVVETASIRWRDDGTAPTSSVGNLWQFTGANTNTPLIYCGEDLTKWQAIAVSGTPVLNVYFSH